MPNANPPDYPEKMWRAPHFGRYGFQPLGPVPPNATESGIVMAEQANITVPGFEEVRRRHIDRETAEAHMLMRVKRKPTDWRAMTWTFNGLTAIQLLGIRVGRDSAIFFNGTDNVIFARKEGDANARSNENFILNINNTLAIETEGEFWGFAAANVTLQLIETWWDLDAIQLASQKIAHHELELAQYGDLQSSTHERKVG
jgi:hypothetical protein